MVAARSTNRANMEEIGETKRFSRSSMRVTSESNWQLQRGAKALEVLRTPYFRRAEPRSGGRDHLNIEQGETAGAEVFHKRHQSDLGGVVHDMEHRFPREK